MTRFSLSLLFSIQLNYGHPEFIIPTFFDGGPHADQDWRHSWAPMYTHRRLGLFKFPREANGRRCFGFRPYTHVRCFPLTNVDILMLLAYFPLSFQAIEYDNHFFVNPGSATGAWSGAFKG